MPRPARLIRTDDILWENMHRAIAISVDYDEKGNKTYSIGTLFHPSEIQNKGPNKSLEFGTLTEARRYITQYDVRARSHADYQRGKRYGEIGSMRDLKEQGYSSDYEP